MAPRVEAAAQMELDLVSRQAEQIRTAVLHTAAVGFATHGYERTRVADICKKVGITGQMLYSFFPSKRHLFIACYEVYYQWMHEQIAPHIAETGDSAARLAWRSWASYGIRSLSPDLQAMARVEAVHPESELRPLVRGLYESILADAQAELADERKPGPTAALFDEELVSYALIGALENMQMRASWDDKFTKRRDPQLAGRVLGHTGRAGGQSRSNQGLGKAGVSCRGVGENKPARWADRKPLAIRKGTQARFQRACVQKFL